MRALLAALLWLCCLQLAGAVLQYDYLNVYSCPPRSCLARKYVRRSSSSAIATRSANRGRGIAGCATLRGGRTCDASSTTRLRCHLKLRSS